MKFTDMVARAGMELKPLYSLKEAAEVSSIPYRTLLDEVNAHRLRSFLPKGRKQGMRIAPEWFDEWFEEGSRG